MNCYQRPLLIAIASTAVHGLCCADSITLKTSVRLTGDDSTITLGQIAAIDGAEAVKFADLKIAEMSTSDGAREILIKDVRAALDSAGAHWGVINLSGRSVIVRPSRDGSAATPLAMKPLSITSTAQRRPTSEKSETITAQRIAEHASVRGVIARRMIEALRVDATSLRLGFDQADAEVLDAPLDGARIELDPQSSLRSDRAAITVRMWDGARIRLQRTVGVEVHMLVRCAVLVDDVAKDQMIAEQNITTSEHWLPPSQAGQALSAVQAVGRLAGRALKAGETVRDSSLRRDAVVKRGEHVTVRCLVGGVAISMQAEARADGAEGDTIEFRKPGERDTFQATITGRGQAVVDLRAQATDFSST